MIKISKSILITLITVFLAACANENHEKIIGDWQGFSWVIEGSESGNDASAVTFSFSEESQYEGNWGSKNETGTFRMDGDKLYTTEDGKLEKMVKVEYLGMDTVVFHMNRMGTEEHLFLVRK